MEKMVMPMMDIGQSNNFINPNHVSHQPKRSKSRFRNQIQTRELSTETPKTNFLAQSPETGRSLVVFLGKRGARGQIARLAAICPFNRKKGFSLSIKFPSFPKLKFISKPS